jgi:hypothetical protein
MTAMRPSSLWSSLTDQVDVVHSAIVGFVICNGLKTGPVSVVAADAAPPQPRPPYPICRKGGVHLSSQSEKSEVSYRQFVLCGCLRGGGKAIPLPVGLFSCGQLGKAVLVVLARLWSLIPPTSRKGCVLAISLAIPPAHSSKTCGLM